VKSLEINEDGLIILRQGIDPVLAKDFQEEWFEYMAPGERDVLFGRTAHSPEFVSEGHRLSGFINNAKHPAIARALSILNLTDDPDWNITTNYQPAHTYQKFHKDVKVGGDMSIVIHGGDNGAFDYSPLARNEKDAEHSYSTVDLSAGDIVLQSEPYIFHRGRNDGDEPRVTAVVSNIDDAQFDESWR
jgi:hypothetical protein